MLWHQLMSEFNYQVAMEMDSIKNSKPFYVKIFINITSCFQIATIIFQICGKYGNDHCFKRS